MTCAGICDADGSCAPEANSDCDASCGSYCTETDDTNDLSDSTAPSEPVDPEPNPVAAGSVGLGCAQDSDCAVGLECITAGFPGGYCSEQDCNAGACPEESDCFITEENEPTMCLAFCESDADCRLGYSCFEPGVCYPDGSNGSGAERCTQGSCPNGEICASSGSCVPMAPDFPAGPVPDCSSAAPDFTNCSLNGGNNACSDLVVMDPRRTDSYWDYPLNGETSTNQYRSYLRRDLALLLTYASDQTHCLSQNWDFGNREPIGLGDMSEADGAIPGTAEGDPGHPVNTHTNGFDIDIGYYQIGMNDNLLRPICNHIVNGQDQYHCTDAPDTLDVWRTALYLGKLHASPYLRVIGVDGKAGADIMAAFAQLCAAGYLDGSVCEPGQDRLAYETENEGMGWYYFHHHHFHVSISEPSQGFNTVQRMPKTLTHDGIFRGYHGGIMGPAIPIRFKRKE